jgi:hypothetical protein
VRWRQEALRAEPDNVSYRSGLATEANNQAAQCLDAGDNDCALQAGQLAWDLLGKLQKDEPREPSWLSFAALHYGRALLAHARPAEALAALKISEQPLQATVSAGKAGPAQVRRLAWTRLLMAGALQQLGRGDEAARTAAVAGEALAAVLKAAPDDRQAWLLSARLAAEQARWPGPQRPQWRAQALAAYARAEALRPLPAADADVRTRQALMSGS